MEENNNLNKVIDEIFTDEWFDNLTLATSAVLKNNTTCFTDEELAAYMINYNVARTIADKFISRIVETLPSELDWTNINPIEAFDTIKDIVEKCDICPTFKTYRVKIITNEYNPFNKNFILWKSLIENTYPHIKIKLIKKSKNIQILAFSIT